MRFNRRLLLNIIFLVLVSLICFSQDLELSEKELTELNIQRLEIEAKIGSISEKIKKMEKEILYSREVVPSPLINEYKSELLKLETQLKKELMTYREKHPVIKKIQTQIDVYENKLREEIEKTAEKKIYSQNPEYMELVSELNRFETENAGLGARIEEIAKIIDEERKKIEEKIDMQKKDNIRQATQEIEVDNSKDIDSLKKMGLFIVLIILCSILFYIFKHIKNKKNKSKKELKDNNILGNIQNIEMKDSESGISSEAVLINDPDNDLKKSIRVIAEKISQRTKTFAVTSLESLTGKTFLSVNLASYWANRGEKTLIIDTNFKQPKIHRIFMKENDTGIADLLIGNITEVIKHTVSNIDIVAAGHNPVGSDEMLESIQFLDIIKNLEDEYSHIIIDTGNVRDNTEPFIIGKYIPLVGVLNREKDVETFENSCDVHSNVIAGTVLNKKS